MRLEHYSPERIRQEIIVIVGRYLDVKKYRVFFFGSRVSGQSREQSDIDVGIEGPVSVPFAVMTEIREEVEQLPTLYKIDIVDFFQVSPGFRSLALRQTQPLNFVKAL